MAKKVTTKAAAAKTATEEKLNPFQQCIKDYLDDLAKKDKLFAKTYKKPNKSIVKCCEYIKSEAKKQQSGGCAAIPDEVVYGWALHYYDEDDIKVEKTNATVKMSGSPVTKAAKPKAKPETDEIPELDISFDLF